MSVRLVIESSPHAQSVTERVFSGGRLVIGRSDDADWVLHDPDMYVSRQHCILTEQNGRVMATDASSTGLFIDNAANPVGTSKAVPIEPGMRLRMGDFVLRVEAVSGVTAGPAPRAPVTGGMVFDFSRREDEPLPPEPAPRPKDLPDPFGLSSSARSHERQRPPAPPKPLDQEDAFSLDLRRAFDQPAPAPSPSPTPARAAPQGTGGGYFDSPALAGTPPVAPAPPPVVPVETPAAAPDLFADWGRPREEAAADRTEAIEATPVLSAPPALAPEPELELEARPDPAPQVPEPAPARAPLDQSPSPQPQSTGGDAYEALLRGMGLDPAQFAGDPAQQAEQIGRSMRILVDGLMQQLRTRAMAKQRARVAQTIVAGANVNPLKFLATSDEVLASFLQPRGRSYLGPEEALNEAFRDLTDHQLRMWAALQTALRRMIDRFDPEQLEKAMADVGLLESLIAGGRSAKLWRLYEERYREIARSAEDQFLGEVGADFREAYESGRS
ncbi:type VI secretion system-associated FHA domain protein TagH [Paracoccus zhejiangensis]|uniref:Type VI secretion system-associated FHA domain protein TagH n=1 Tax=Paracoccus zhejiangensis TaxID=1077935 RepID=A0A2H5F4R0_9RHOB|nr:type VI secretion system-associated FHA domain protein TagH [Paracoccus zhejiangensis]AUH66530.1 type VI secretion system-associated FHA domain protein TagH [Paracoccus zhejiangensis]